MWFKKQKGQEVGNVYEKHEAMGLTHVWSGTLLADTRAQRGTYKQERVDQAREFVAQWGGTYLSVNRIAEALGEVEPIPWGMRSWLWKHRRAIAPEGWFFVKGATRANPSLYVRMNAVEK